MTFQELKEKALSLPYAPGVYIMRDKSNTVIYVGKAKKLKNRVSQYFQDSAAHTPKTKMMVSKIDHFDVIVAASEFEALVLECSQIKQYMPKYNILLKDDKGYPYLRLDMHEEYPRITLVNKMAQDGAAYFGPYGSRGLSQNAIVAIEKALKLPQCSKQFPRDLGKERPCLNYQMNLCSGWCQLSKTSQQYKKVIEQAKMLLSGDYKVLAAEIHDEMLEASDNLEFERAAELRDRLKAVESLGEKSLVTAGTQADTDVVGFYQTEARACFAVLHFFGGALIDKDYEILPVQDDPEAAVSSLVKQYYLARGLAPKVVMLPTAMEDAELFEELLLRENGKRTRIRVPQRGDNVRLTELAEKNAREEAERVTTREERIAGSLTLLGKMLSMEAPRRIESFDISNIAGTDIVASMIVYGNGKPDKKSYKRFKVEGLSDQDDYASMYQVLTRRYTRLKNGDPGFDTAPDLILLDGGANHAAIGERVLSELGLSIPVFGMVKDNRHRTRALTDARGNEIALVGQTAVFALVGNIQEEVHRFAITYHRELRSRRLRYSKLDEIPGIGPKRKEQLLKKFKSLSAISKASLEELEEILPVNAAEAVQQFFQEKEEAPCESSLVPPEE